MVALSGYGQDAEMQAALDAGFDEHVTKPPERERIESLLSHSGVSATHTAPA